MGAANLAPRRIRSPNGPNRSELLHRPTNGLSYPGWIYMSVCSDKMDKRRSCCDTNNGTGMLQDGLPSWCLDGLKRGGATAAEPTSCCWAECCGGRRAIFRSDTRGKLIRRTFLNATWRVAGLTDGIKTLETYCLGAADSVWFLSTPLVAEC